MVFYSVDSALAISISLLATISTAW